MNRQRIKSRLIARLEQFLQVVRSIEAFWLAIAKLPTE